MKPADVPLEDLLSHASWVRGLAGALVRDGATADDLVQEVWLAALRRPPSGDRPVRPWLAGVLRNLTKARARASARRDRHEKAAPSAAGVPSPAQLAEQLEAHRVLASLVAELPEPQRTVVLLRYFRGLSSTEIERALGVPAGTVRRRLKEGLDRLRQRLDARHGGNRRAWALVLVPLAGMDEPPVATRGPDLGNGLIGGTIAMAVTHKLSLGIAAVLVVAGLLWQGAGGDQATPATPATPPAPDGTAARMDAPRGGGVVAPRGRAEETSDEVRDPSKSERPAASTESALRVTVRRDDGTAAAGARVLLVSSERVADEARTDEAGVASFAACDDAVAVVASLPGLPPAEARVPAKCRDVEMTLPAAQAHVAGIVRVDGAAPPGPFTLRLQLETPWAKPGVVPDGTWSPLRHAGVEPQSATSACDAAGRFRFDGLRAGSSASLLLPRGFRLAPGRGDAAGASLATEVPADEVFVDLVRLPRITGRVLDGTLPAVGAKIVLRLCMREDMVTVFDKSSVVTQADGRFELLLPTGELSGLTITASRADGSDAVLREHPTVPDRDLDLGDLRLAKSFTIPLLVLDEAGSPIVGAVARIDQDEPVLSEPSDAFGRTSLRAAAEPVTVIVGAIGYGVTHVGVAVAGDVPHRVVLPAAATLEVAATTRDGSAIVDAQLLLLLTIDGPAGVAGALGGDQVFVAAGASASRMTIAGEKHQGRLVRLAAGGPTILTGLRPGMRLRLRLLDALGALLADETVRLEPLERRRVTLPIDKARWDLAVAVVDEVGRALGAANLRVSSPVAEPEIADLARYGIIGTSERTDAEGLASLHGLLGDEIELLAWAPERLPARVRVRRAGDATVKIVLTRASAVEVALQDAAGNPVTDAEIHAAARDEDRGAPWAPNGVEPFVWRGVHVGGGTYRIEGLPAAEIVLVVKRKGTEHRSTHDAREGHARIRL